MTLAAVLKLGADPLGWEILPRIHIGPLSISPHGIGIALGFLAGARLLVRRARERGGPSETDLWNALFYALLGSLVGARVGYVLGHIPDVTNNGQDPLGILRVWEGGVSLLGGITGGVLAALPYMLKKKMGFWATMDLAAPGMALGIFVGRIGDLIIGDHLGRPTSLPWGWRCLGEIGGGPPVSASVYRAELAAGHPPSLGCFNVTLHQTALYDFVSAGVLLAVLLWVGRRRHNIGFLILLWAAWYGVMRVILDSLRVDRRYFGLTGSQILALAVVLVAGTLLVRYRGVPPSWRPESSATPDPTTESDQAPPS